VVSSPILTMTNKTTGEKAVFEIDQNVVELGRDRSNFIVLNTRAISRRHAQIFKDGEQFYLTDLKSGNGTFLNNSKITPGEKTLLRNGDTVTIEDFEFHFQPYSGNPDLYEVTDTDILEIKMIKKLLRAVDKENAPFLEITGGRYKGKKMVLEGKVQEITIGRDEACEFVIKDDVISRKHVRIVKKWDTITIQDLGSKNKTFVNRQPIEAISEYALKDGDIILLGTLPILFRNPQALNLSPLAPKIPKDPPPLPPSEPLEKEQVPGQDFQGRGSGRSEAPPPLQESPQGIVPYQQGPMEEYAPAPPSFLKRLSPFEVLLLFLGLAILGGSFLLLLSFL